MELSERKLRILEALIDDYIATGVPVGSRTLSKRFDMEISSATIRNEMADLEESGYLFQPHASAGRTPSDKAYRLYVDTLMKAGKLAGSDVQSVRGYFDRRLDKITEIMEITARALSETTQLVSVVMAPEFSNIELKRIQVVKITDRKAMLLMVFSSGLIKDVLITVPPDMSESSFEVISNILSEAVANKTLSDAANVLRVILRADMEADKQFISNIMDALATNGEPATTGNKVVLDGTNNLFIYPEYQDFERARDMLRFFEQKNGLYDMLRQATTMEIKINIGNENLADELKATSVVTATYKAFGKSIGSFGVIGPMRMNYARVISILSLVEAQLNDVVEHYIDGEPKNET